MKNEAPIEDMADDDHLRGIGAGEVVTVYAPSDSAGPAWDGNHPVYLGPVDDDPDRVWVRFPDGVVDQMPRRWVSRAFPL